MTYYTAPRLWPGETVACVASGPSLTPEDCEYLRGKVRVIAVNDGIRYTKDFADVLYSSDWRWWQAHKAYPFNGLKVAIEQGRGEGSHWYQGLTDTVGIMKNTGAVGLDPNPDSLRNYGNSGSAAIHLAYHFGATRVLLLGYDFGYRSGIAARHFHGDILDHEINASKRDYHQSLYDGFIRKTEQMAKPLKDAGVEVINCTEGSHLKCFPFMPLREALLEVAA